MSYIGNQPISAAFLTDTFNGNGSTTVYTMTVAPASTSSILVSVTGVLQDPGTYSVSGTTLTFSQAPPSGTGNISVRYLGIPASGVATTAYRTVTEFTATAGQTTFSVPSYTVGYIDIYRNGVMLGSADYTASNGTTVVLATGATAGDLIETISFYVSSVLNAIPATTGSVGSSYIANGAIDSTKIANDAVGAAQIAAGAVGTSEIADNSVTTAKIAAGAVVQADIATGVAGTGPAFSAFQSGAQTISAGTFAKLQINTEEFDTNSNYDTTLYRFTPTVAGYYQVNGSLTVSTAAQGYITIYKNGSTFKGGNNITSSGVTVTVSALIYLNGSTDYIELYGFNSASNAISTGAANTYFQAFLARAA